MGIIASYFGGNSSSNEPDPVTGLTPKEKALVESSWGLVKKDILAYGIELFMIFFRKSSEYQNAFSFRDVPYEELPNNAKLKAHATNVMYALSAIVDNLNNNDILISLLEKNAESHAKRNIKPKAYADLKETFLELLEKQQGTKLSEDAKKAWEKTLTVAFTVITNNMEQHRKNDQPLNN